MYIFSCNADDVGHRFWRFIAEFIHTLKMKTYRQGIGFIYGLYSFRERETLTNMTFGEMNVHEPRRFQNQIRQNSVLIHRSTRFSFGQF